MEKDTNQKNDKDDQNEDNNQDNNQDNKDNNQGNDEDMQNLLKQMLFKNNIKKGEQVKDIYKFWDTQPVPRMDSEEATEVGPIISENDIEVERKEPYNLPTGYIWYDIDIHDDKELTMVKNYLIFSFMNF
jgi:hypothetical protein